MVDKALSGLGGLRILVSSTSLLIRSLSAVGPGETVNEYDLLNDFKVKYVRTLRCTNSLRLPSPTSSSRAGVILSLYSHVLLLVRVSWCDSVFSGGSI